MSGLSTLLLVDNDLCLDVSGNIAVASPPYSYAQDSASAIKLLPAELIYDTSQGQKLVEQPLSLIRANCISAAKTVPGVVSAQVFFTSFENRALTGQCQITDSSGNISVSNF
jgi:hypothetical protein